ncbi:hypothetical protein R0K30_02205 [Bacillus sp. SIMBA_154]|uniref:hypothetical protein n=1 Tax=Bacillus sp. SIMBA_154 TaxID=3080859 RepID=UPI0039780B5C
MNIVYCVFNQLKCYYDDNDKTLFQIVDSKDKAISLVKEYPQYDLFYEKWEVR